MINSVKTRRSVVQRLRMQVDNDIESTYRQNAAFQLAICYRLGLGGLEDECGVTQLLNTSGRSLGELQNEIELICTRDRDGEIEYENDEMATFQVAGFFYDLGRPSSRVAVAYQEERLLDLELKKMQQKLTPSDWVLMRLRLESLEVMQEQNHYDEVLRLKSEMLQILENDPKYGPRDSQTMSLALSVSKLFLFSGQLKEGISLCEFKIKTCMETFGDLNLRTVAFQVLLAQFYEQQDRHDQSEKLFRHALSMHTALLSRYHPQTLDTLECLARLLSNLHRHDEALEAMLEVVQGSITTLGKDHPRTLLAQNTIASIFLMTGAYWQAEKLSSMAATALRDSLGDEFASLAVIMSNLATAIALQGRYKEAEEVNREALARLISLYGPHHHNTLTQRYNLAKILLDLQENSEAEIILREVAQQREAQLGKLHSSTLQTTTALVVALRNQGRPEEARSLQSNLLDICGPASPRDRYRVLELRVQFCHTLRLIDDPLSHNVALEMLRTVLQVQTATALESDQVDAHQILTRLPELLEGCALTAHAREYFASELLSQQREGPSPSTRVATIKYWLAAIHTVEGQAKGEAESLLNSAWEDLTEIMGEDHWISRRLALLLDFWRRQLRECEGEELVEEEEEEEGAEEEGAEEGGEVTVLDIAKGKSN